MPQHPLLIMNGGEVRDLVEHVQSDKPYPMRLSDGTDITVVAGDPESGHLGREYADLEGISLQTAGL